jgi:hypothetical protein
VGVSSLNHITKSSNQKQATKTSNQNKQAKQATTPSNQNKRRKGPRPLLPHLCFQLETAKKIVVKRRHTGKTVKKQKELKLETKLLTNKIGESKFTQNTKQTKTEFKCFLRSSPTLPSNCSQVFWDFVWDNVPKFDARDDLVAGDAKSHSWVSHAANPEEFQPRVCTASLNQGVPKFQQTGAFNCCFSAGAINIFKPIDEQVASIQ